MTTDITQAVPAAEVLSHAWQAALGTPPSGPGADFFAAGGDSLLVVRMVSRIRKGGLTVDVNDVLRGRTFDGILSRMADAAPARPAAGLAIGAVPLLPSQRRWIANQFTDPDHFSLGWIFDVPQSTPDGRPVDAPALEGAVRALAHRHEALRTKYVLHADGSADAEVLPDAPDGFLTIHDVADEDVREVLADGFRSHRLAEGRVLTARWLPAQRLLQLALHHLTLDGISVEILADDLEDLLVGSEPPHDPRQPRAQAMALSQWLASSEAVGDAKAWADQEWSDVRPVPTEMSGDGRLPSMDLSSIELAPAVTAAVERLAERTGLGVESLVLAAGATAIMERFGLPVVSVDTYHHGRDVLPGADDLASGIGYYQANYPVVLTGPVDGWLARAVSRINALPKNRFGFDALRFAGHPQLQDLPDSSVRLNFRSRMNVLNARANAWLVGSDITVGGRRSRAQTEPYVLMLEGDLIGDRLTVNIKYSQDHYRPETIDGLVRRIAVLLADAAGQGRS
jgi:Condensation domain/Phosphopantetheine attachment site